MEAGTLRLAYPLSAGHDTVPRLVQALHAAYPGITVTTEVLPSPRVLLAVRDRRADAGIAREPEPMAGIQLQPLRHDRLGVLVAADHPLGNSATVELTAVADYPVALHPRAANPSHYDFIVGLFASRGLRPSLAERNIAFDLSLSVITSGEAATLVGYSSAVGLPSTVRWVPLADYGTVSVTLVLPADEPPATVTRFHHVARTHAATHDWLA